LGQALRLEGATPQQGQMSIASPLLIKPDDNSNAFVFNQRLGDLHLLPTVALDAIEHVRRKAVRMHTT
jgi:hypothetical protein